MKPVSTVHLLPAATESVSRLDSYAAATLFLSRVLLSSPDGLLLSQLSQPGVLDDWPLPEPRHRVGLTALAASTGPRGESLDEVHDDHQRLFLGPEQVLACPYESVYLNVEHLTFGSETLAVRRWYHRHGLTAPGEGREPDDHIGLELGFISHLCLQGLDAAERGEAESVEEARRAVGMFMAEHLLLWSDECLDHVLANAKTQFYRGVAQLAKGTIEGLARDFAR